MSSSLAHPLPTKEAVFLIQPILGNEIEVWDAQYLFQLIPHALWATCPCGAPVQEREMNYSRTFVCISNSPTLFSFFVCRLPKLLKVTAMNILNCLSRSQSQLWIQLTASKILPYAG